METREQLLALEEELRRLRAHGQRAVSVDESSLEELRHVVEALKRGQSGLLGTPSVMPPADGVAAPRAMPGAPLRRPVSTLGLPPPPAVNLPAGDKRARWEALRAQVLADPVCKAKVYPGKQVVFGVGNLDAAIMFVGEAPGGDEEDQGEPFVGRAGQLLNKMIGAMGLQREQVYIGNILNWRPEMPRNPDGSQTGNRPPTPEEMNYCLPFIRAQLDIIRPKVIVTLGKTAVDGLLGFDRFKSMGAARGAWHDYEGTPLRATYHPSYLLRQEGLTSLAAKKIKRDAWEDLLAAMEKAGLPISDKQRRYFL